MKILTDISTASLTRRHRARDPQERKKYVALVEGVQRKGGEVLRFSSMHESGQRMFIAPSIMWIVIDFFSRAEPAHWNRRNIDFSPRRRGCRDGRTRGEGAGGERGWRTDRRQ